MNTSSVIDQFPSESETVSIILPLGPFIDTLVSESVIPLIVYPLIFSTTPITGIEIVLAKLIDFLLSNNATSCGVVTMTTPSIVGRLCETVSGSSLVPGGKSIIKASSSPHSTSPIN